MLFTEVVAASAAVGATRARTAKAAALAALLRAAAPDEVEPATAWLAGEPRQGRIGTGWRTLVRHRRAARGRARRSPSTAVDATLDALAATAGAGSDEAAGRAAARPVRRRHRATSSGSSPRCSPASCATARWRA